MYKIPFYLLGVIFSFDLDYISCQKIENLRQKQKISSNFEEIKDETFSKCKKKILKKGSFNDFHFK